jgi:histone H2A
MPAASKTLKSGKEKKPGVSKSKQADLQFPVGRIGRKLRKGNFAKQVGDGAAVFLAGVLEFLVGEVVDLAGSVCKNEARSRITPPHVFSGIQEDANLVELFSNVIISEGGHVESIHEELLHLKKKSRSQSQRSQGDASKSSEKKKDKTKGKSKDKMKGKSKDNMKGKSKDKKDKSKSKDKKKSGKDGSKSKSQARGKSQKVSQAV